MDNGKKTYNFWGWKNADAPAIKDEYPGINTPTDPVSYTHLDVYKRQRKCRNRDRIHRKLPDSSVRVR